MVRVALVRTFTLLVTAAGLAACVADTGAGGYNQPTGLNMVPAVTRAGPAPGTEAPGHRVSILVPLTGPNAEVGQVISVDNYQAANFNNMLEQKLKQMAKAANIDPELITK